MARFARVVIADVPHHVTQRGNARQAIFDNDTDRRTYLGLLGQYCRVHDVALLGYCLMSNHVHLIAVPHTTEGLGQVLKQAHGRYAAYWNARQSSSGHAWQGRFYSCPLDESHLWKALRYVELNPVRAGMVKVGGALALVERSGALWSSDSGDAAGPGALAPALDAGRVGGFPVGGRFAGGGGPVAPLDSHRTSSGDSGVCGGPGRIDSPASSSAESRTPQERGCGSFAK